MFFLLAHQGCTQFFRLFCRMEAAVSHQGVVKLSYFSCLIQMRLSIFILIEAHEWQSHTKLQFGRDDPKCICPSCRFLHSHKILLFCLVTDVTCLLSVNRSYMNYVVCVPMHITDVLHAQLCIIFSIVTI